MKISLNWLKDYVKIPAKYSAKDIGKLLTLHTAEVEEVMEQGKGLEGVVVGELLECSKHPDADKLHVSKVDIGKDKPIQVVFGQMAEMKPGYKIPVAVAPTTLPTGMEIKSSELRGVLSEGMLCLDQELGLKEEGVSIEIFDKSIKNGTPISKALKLDDTIIEIDNKSLTHRPDLWGHYGIAREVAALTGAKLEKISPKVDAKKSHKSGKSLEIEIKNPELCPRYIGVRISGIKVEESPEWLRRKLLAAGHAVYNNIVDITNFVSSELGQPMHAFDARFIDGGIVVRTAKKGEKMTTLDNKERLLTDKMLLICDHKKPVALAGVMGGQNSEIKQDTTEIIFEAANFDAPCVRKTSVALGLRTESVQRFEKSLDPALAETAMLRAIELTLKLCPSAKLESEIIDIDNSKPKNLTVKTTADRVCSKIGTQIAEKEIIRILESLEFEVKKTGEDLSVKVPSFRSTKDVEGEDDIIEEVARIFGYGNIPSVLPLLPAKLPEENRERFLKHKARDIISLGLGFTELSNYSFYSADDIAKTGLETKDHIKLLNYLSQDQTHLRVSMLPNMLKGLCETIKYDKAPRLYEIGHTYREIGNFMPLEEKWIIGLTVGKNSFFEAKGSAEAFLEKFGAENVRITPSKNTQSYAHPTKCTEVAARGQQIGSIYEVHPEVITKYELAGPVSVFEINFTKLVSIGQRQHKYVQIPKFPSMEFDISVVLQEKVPAASVQDSIERSSKDLIESVELFDIYRGQGLGEKEKALAYHVIMRAKDRTLNDEEMAQVQKKVFQNLEKLGGKIRGK